MTDTLEVGNRIQDVRSRSKRGVITDGPVQRGGRLKIRVEWESGSSSWVSPTLVAHAGEDRTVVALLRERSFGGREDFVRTYTHRKLLTPVDDTLYSLSASRTQLLAHQFKPLIKFLESVHRRFLVADEVGLGKTIEAGIIIAELRARQSLGGVLVICPNQLRDKWHSELLVRFDEEFEIITRRRDWSNHMRRWEQEGTDGARFIIGHRTLADQALLEAAEEGVPSFDLIVVDEAHHARNTATIFRQILGELADAAHQLLLLTATPLQTQVDNLLSLLRLIDEDAFRSRDLFASRLDVNRQLVRAETILRRAGSKAPSRIEAAKRATQELAEVGYSDRHNFGLDGEQGLDEVERILRDGADEGAIHFDGLLTAADRLRHLNLLSPFMTRTRKIDVQDTCERRVEAVRPDLTEEEQDFYRATVDWMKKTVRDRHGADKVAFLTREPERRLASCFHGFWRRLNQPPDDAELTLSDPPPHVRAAYERLHGIDTKYAELRSVLQGLAADDPATKTIVFATFRYTIAYLHERLEGDGIDHEWIHGGVPMDPTNDERDERGRRVRRFLQDPECRVLISSSVGGEGLDLQQASVVVNYDLPWNPALVEQRIGRVDRFGQESDVVHVLNVILPGTVEDLVFTRLIDRLNLFRDTVGDLAVVLGPIVRELSVEFLSKDLSPQEAADRADDAEHRARNKIKHTKDLMERENEFIAFDEDFLDVLQDMERQGQTFRPAEVAAVCEGIIRRNFKESFLRPAEEHQEGGKEVYELSVGFRLRELLKSAQQERPSSILRRFMARLPEGAPRRVTFDGETAEAHPDVLLLTTRHPFLRELVRFSETSETFHSVAAVRLSAGVGTQVESGLLALFEARLQFGTQTRRFLLPTLVTPSGGAAELEASRRLLRRALDDGVTDAGTSAPEGEALVKLFQAASRAAEDRLRALADRLLAEEVRRIRPRVGELRARYDRRIANTTERLWRARSDGESDRVDAIGKYLRRLEREKKREIEQLERLPDPEEEIVPVGATWLVMA